MADETSTTTWTRPDMDTDVHRVLESLVLDAAERAAARVVDTVHTDMAASRQSAAGSAEDMRVEISQEARRHARRVGAWVGTAVVAFISAGGFAVWTAAGPEQAVQRVEAAAERVDTKAGEVERTRDEIDEAVSRAIEDERTKVRHEMVDGRIGGLEDRMVRVEGAVGSAGAKIDALLSAQLGRAKANKVKAAIENASRP